MILFSWDVMIDVIPSAEAGAGVGLLFILPRPGEPQSRELTTKF